MYDRNKDNLTGSKFLLKTNSVAPLAQSNKKAKNAPILRLPADIMGGYE